MTTRPLALAVGVLAALAIAHLARRARSLSPTGEGAAIVVGALAVAAGWQWGVLLVLFFVTGTALSRWHRAAKETRTGSVVEKGGERDAVQVLANGGVFALAALVALVRPDHAALAFVAGAGALAAAASDTWATEIGTAVGGRPHSLLTLRPVAIGMSGGVTLPGTIAALGGALCIALAAALLAPFGAHLVAIAAGGVIGSTVDSLLGATLQARRHCDACDRDTERPIHDCGTPTRPARGIGWMGNDAVNAACTAAGALAAALLAR